MNEQTSLDAFLSLSEVGTAFRRRQVFEALRQGPANDRMIVDRTGLAINSVTPRRGELVDLGLVTEDRRDACPFTGKKTIFWKVNGVME